MQDVYSYINSASLDMLLIQYNDTNTSNQIVIDEMSGSGNTVRLAQGAAWDSATSTTYTYDSIEKFYNVSFRNSSYIECIQH